MCIALNVLNSLNGEHIFCKNYVNANHSDAYKIEITMYEMYAFSS